MGQKKRSKRKQNERERKNKKYFPIFPESENKVETEPEIKAFDFLNILTREHLQEMLKEFGDISLKHNRDLDPTYEYKSCRDLKMEEISRLKKLIIEFSTLNKKEKKRAEAMEKDKRKTSSSAHNKEIVSTGNEKFYIKMKYQMNLEKIQSFHRFNIEFYKKQHRYQYVGLNKFRNDQCPSVPFSKTILETERSFNYILQETMLSLKITNEQMIYENIKEDTIRILAFGMKQTEGFVEFFINIPEIKKYDKEIAPYCSETNILLLVDDHKGKDYIFEIHNFANEINPHCTPKCLIYDDFLVIKARKKKPETWKQLFKYEKKTKDLWKKEMMEVLVTMKPKAQDEMEPLDFAWNIALILVNCGAELLNLPHDLNHVNQRFETLEEMIIYYKIMISLNSHLKALFYILGGALYSKLMNSSSRSNLRESPKKKDLSKYEEETYDKIRKAVKKCQENYNKGYDLYTKKEYGKALALFDKALSFCTVPEVHLARGYSLSQIGRYEEAFIDSIFALHNLGLYDGYPAVLTILKCKIESGNVIYALDMTISLEYNYRKELNKNEIETLKSVRKDGLCILNNIFKSHSLIFRKKYKDAIPFLEKAESIINIKAGHTSVILLLLYFLCKDYEKVSILGNKILGDDGSYKDLVCYLLGMSAYYTKHLHVAINYLGKLNHIGIVPLSKIEVLRRYIHDAKDLMKGRNLVKELPANPHFADELLVIYHKAKDLAKDNDQLLAHIWTKLGVLNFLNENFKEAVRYLTFSIDLIGGNKNILLVRSEAYTELCMMNEAEEDRKAVHNLMVNEANDRNVASEL